MSTPKLSTAMFRSTIIRWFERNGRDLPWRKNADPWLILVSEMMLQQTQVDRVKPKFLAFAERWPSPVAFAAEDPAAVITFWQGLGYNRRALNLWKAARMIVDRFDAQVPNDPTALKELPGIGDYTSKAVTAFAWNRDVSLWDTNIRRIALRFFFGGEFAEALPGDDVLAKTLAAALPQGRSRDWHGALMDFGSAVCTSRAPKCSVCPLRQKCLAAAGFVEGRPIRQALIRSQTTFEGSHRQARGKVLRLLATKPAFGVTKESLRRSLKRPDFAKVINGLLADGLIVRQGARIRLPGGGEI